MPEGQIHHIEIYVSNLEQSRRFWDWFLQKLHYELYQQWSEGFSYIRDSTYIVFVQTKKHYLSPSYHRCRTGINHLAFEINSLELFDELSKECAEYQIPILYKSKSELNFDREKILFIEDPDRIKVEIILTDSNLQLNSQQDLLTMKQSFALGEVVVSLKTLNPEKTKNEIENCLFLSIHLNKIYETILQSYLFYGFPSALEGVRVFYEVLCSHNSTLEVSEDIPFTHWKNRGEKICEQVYKNHYSSLIHHLSQMSPELTDWMILEGYGKVLGRSVLPLETREFLNVAMLSQTTFVRQLHSHLHGALNTGFPIEWLIQWFREREKLLTGEIWEIWEKFYKQVSNR